MFEGMLKFVKPIATGIALMGALSATEVKAEHNLENNEKPKVGTSFTVGIEKMPERLINKDANIQEHVGTTNLNGESSQKTKEVDPNNFFNTDESGNTQKRVIKKIID